MFSCSSKDNMEDSGEIITYDSQHSYDFKDIMDVVDFIPLKLEDLALDGFSEIFLNDSSIFVVDKTLQKTIYHFDKTGGYINSIGTIGRAYNEYLDLSDVVFTENSVLVFDSKNQRVLFYGVDGKLQKKDVLKRRFQKAHPVGDDYILYLGHCNGYEKWRLFNNKHEGNFLKSNNDITHFSELFPVFCSYNDSIYVRETLSNQIYLVCHNQIMTLYTFDFGENNIPAEFYTQSSARESTEVLLKSEYTYQRQFCITKQYALIENVINKRDGALFVYAILNKSSQKWIWVNQSALQNTSPFSETFKFIDEQGYFYFLLDGEKQNELGKSNAVIGNYEYGLLKCKLKVGI